jgi:N-hydroxyarylamine O-acetyltransferase
MKKIEKFLKRINYQGRANVDLESLTKLQTSFLKTVPFENLDIMLGKTLDYSQESVFDKIVTKNRGGLCYECNGLFHDMLNQIGFDVSFIICAMFPDKAQKIDFSHMALVVTLNNIEYLVDVGNGKSFGEPLTIQTISKSQSEGVSSTVKPYSHDYYGLFYLIEKKWEARYIFNLERKIRADFTEPCHFVDSSPDSEFTQKRLVSVLFDDKRVTLTGDKIISTFFDEESLRERVLEEMGLNISTALKQ